MIVAYYLKFSNHKLYIDINGNKVLESKYI